MSVKKHFSAETTICGFQLKSGVCRYWIGIRFHRKSNFKNLRSNKPADVPIRTSWLDYNLSVERHTWLDGKGLASCARKVDCLKDDLADIIAIEVSDLCGSEKFFIKVRFDGGVFKRETNYPGSASIMKLMGETEENKPVEQYAELGDIPRSIVGGDIENEDMFATLFHYAD